MNSKQLVKIEKVRTHVENRSLTLRWCSSFFHFLLHDTKEISKRVLNFQAM